MTRSVGSLVPVCVIGAHPDLSACVTYTAALLSRAPDLRDGIHSAASTPAFVTLIHRGGEICGVLAFGPKRSMAEYAQVERALLVDAAAQMSSLLETRWQASFKASGSAGMCLLQPELPPECEVQSQALPLCSPAIAGIEYYGECRLAGNASKDFFDFRPLNPSQLITVVGNVSGYGHSSAILMSGLQAYLQGLAPDHCDDLSLVIHKLNRTICEISPEEFYAALFYARFDPSRSRLEYVSAGHESALLIRKGRSRVHHLESTGAVLGLTRHSTFRQRTLLMEPGDVLVALTEEIASTHSEGRGELRDRDVVSLVREHQSAGATELVERLLERIDQSVARTPRQDDRTVVVVRFTDPAEHAGTREDAADLVCAAA